MALGGHFTFRTKKHDQTLDTKCRKVDLYGEMGIQFFSKFVSQKREGLRRPDLFYPVRTLPQSWGKKVSPGKLFEGQINNSYTVRATFVLGQSSISLPILIRWWQPMARWNCRTKADPFLAFYVAGGKHNYKNELLLQGKQTVST